MIVVLKDSYHNTNTIINKYYSTNIITPNTPNNTSSSQSHINTPKKKQMCDYVGFITLPKRGDVPEISDEDTGSIIKEIGIEGHSKADFIKKYILIPFVF